MGNASVDNLFDHKEAIAVMRLMGDAYKAGVRDAEWVNDAGRCLEHIASTSQHGVYGRVTDNSTYDWRRWKHNILLFKDDTLANCRMVDVTARIKKWWCIEGCILPLSQDFYNQGLRHWNDYPVSRILEKMQKIRYPIWTKRGAVNRTFSQMWVQLRTFAYDRSQLYEGTDSALSLTPRKFETFSLGLWQGYKMLDEKKHILRGERGDNE